LFDQRGDVVNEIFNFAEEALANGESTLVHSVKGQSRSCCVIAAYFMKRFNKHFFLIFYRFRWSLYKTLEFLTSRRPDLEIRASFYHQLTNLEARVIQENGGVVSGNWYDMKGEVDHDELLLRNTFLNAKNAPLDEHLINPRISKI
jgi:Dual specificity phosphatase, catalytic domain